MSTRKYDSNVRDAELTAWHTSWDIDFPVTGMTLLMVEYDRGCPVGLINYIRRDGFLPRGESVAWAFKAFGSLKSPEGTQLPFMTALYDRFNWSFQLFPHNDAAERVLGRRMPTPMSELEFVRMLYKLRGRELPSAATLERGGVNLYTHSWTDEQAQPMPPNMWPGRDISIRRRQHQLQGSEVQFRSLNPCADIDLAVIGDSSGRVELIVDYKRESALVKAHHATYRAMSGMVSAGGDAVPAMIVRYQLSNEDQKPLFAVHCLNDTAAALLRDVMGPPVTEWVTLDEGTWIGLLLEARSR